MLQDAPKVICDTAHNSEGLVYVMEQLLKEKHEKLHIVLGVVNDKDLELLFSDIQKSTVPLLDSEIKELPNIEK